MTITKRMKKTFDLVKGGEAVSTAMRKAGYTKMTAKKPQELRRKLGWKELMERELPDEFLAEVHKQGLKATKKELTGREPDYSTRHKYLDTAYKIKGKFPKETNIGVAVQVNVNEDKEKFSS